MSSFDETEKNLACPTDSFLTSSSSAKAPAEKSESRQKLAENFSGAVSENNQSASEAEASEKPLEFIPVQRNSYELIEQPDYLQLQPDSFAPVTPQSRPVFEVKDKNGSAHLTSTFAASDLERGHVGDVPAGNGRSEDAVDVQNLRFRASTNPEDAGYGDAEVPLNPGFSGVRPAGIGTALGVKALTKKYLRRRTKAEKEAALAARKAWPLYKRVLYSLFETLVALGIAVLASVIITTYLFQAFWIPSGSMELTLMPNDRIYVNKLKHTADQIHRGDVVVFVDPDNWINPSNVPHQTGLAKYLNGALKFIGLASQGAENHLIKRVIGVGGDHVSCAYPGAPVVINGVEINEPYIHPGQVPSQIAFDIEVPKGYLWVMGDNRQFSADSRFHQNDAHAGLVPVDNVTGKASFIAWPLSRIGWIGSGGNTFAKVPAGASANN